MDAITETAGKAGMVYLIHFDKKLGHARHYIGWTSSFAKRIDCHRKGHGAAILRACNERGIKWEVVRQWEGDGFFERKLKKRKNSKGLCPVCQNERQDTENNNVNDGGGCELLVK